MAEELHPRAVMQKTLIPPQFLPQGEPIPDTPPIAMTQGLTYEETQFVHHFLRHGHYRGAYKFAYPKANCDERLAAERGRTLAEKPHIQEALQRIRDWYASALKISEHTILAALKTQAFLDASDMYADNGDSWELLPISAWPLALRQAVQKIKITEYTLEKGGTRRIIDVEFPDRQNALALLGKHLNMFQREKQLSPFTLVVNTQPPQGEQPGQPAQTIQGMGLTINLPATSFASVEPQEQHPEDSAT